MVFQRVESIKLINTAKVETTYWNRKQNAVTNA